MTSVPGKKSRSFAWLFWAIVLLIAVVFLAIQESGRHEEQAAPDATGNAGLIPEQAEPATGISEATKLISDSKENTSNLAVPFSRIFRTPAVNDILVDPKGRVWVAHEGGVSSIIEDKVQLYSINEGSFPYAQASSLAFDGKTVWVGTLAGLCRQNESGRFVRADQSDSLPSQLIWSLKWDGTTLWAGTQNGTAFLKPGSQFQTINEHNTNGGLLNNWCRHIARFSTWFVAAHDRGLSIWNINFPASNPELWKNVDHARSVISRPITDMAFDGKHLWLSCARGVLMLSTPAESFFNNFMPNMVSFSRIHGLPDNRVNTIIAHREAIWTGTDEGLARIKNERINLITASSGDFSPRIRKLAASGDILWIGTDKGVQFINTAMVD